MSSCKNRSRSRFRFSVPNDRLNQSSSRMRAYRPMMGFSDIPNGFRASKKVWPVRILSSAGPVAQGPTGTKMAIISGNNSFSPAVSPQLFLFLMQIICFLSHYRKKSVESTNNLSSGSLEPSGDEVQGGQSAVFIAINKFAQKLFIPINSCVVRRHRPDRRIRRGPSTQNLPTFRLQKRLLESKIATYAPSQSGVCCV